MFKIFDINLLNNYDLAMEQLKEIGEKIRQKRLSLNMTMDCCAEKAGISRATLWSIERGTSNCSVKALFNLMTTLGLSFSLNDSECDTKRIRATRLNSVQSKKINRFLIMCIENYAESVSESSSAVYKKMKDQGIVDILKDEYEDLHGFSLAYINDYISNLSQEKPE